MQRVMIHRLVVALVGLSATAAHAQIGWNREVLSVHAVEGSGPGLFDVVVKWSFQVGPTPSVLDLGTSVEVQVAGLLLTPVQVSLIIDPNSGSCGAICAQPCGSATIDTTPVTLYCDQITCACGPPGSVALEQPLQGDESDEFLALRATFPDVAILVGDQIQVTLVPLPTAVPELDTSDDSLTTIFQGLQRRPGDSDGDDDNDLLDFRRFQICFGSAPPLSPDCIFADSDGNGSVDVQDTGDGFDLSGPVFPCDKFGLKFNWPLPGQDADDWVINNYYDLDPNSGSACNPGVLDYASGRKTYNGHSGVDIFPPNFRAMDGLMVVLAAQEGRVEDFEDYHFDRNIVNMDGVPGNFVKLCHANGFQTRYWHLKRFSVAALGIQKGDWIAAGQPIGVVGSSGNSSGCHLHFSVRDCDGKNLDPFLEDMWLNPPVYHTPLGYMDLWLKDGSISGDDEVKDPTPDVQNLSVNDTLGIGLYTGGGQPGDEYEVRIVRGNGTVFETISDTLATEQCRPFKRRWWNRTIDNETGLWSVQVRINGQLKATKSFNVSP